MLTVVLLEIGSILFRPFILKSAGSRGEAGGPAAAQSSGTDAEQLASNQPEEFQRNHILHPYLGFVANPGTYASGWEFFRNGQTATVNDQGFVGPDPLLKRESNSVNICLIGGSFAKNLYLDSKDTLIAELAGNKSFHGKKINIVSAAMSGWKQPQQLLALNYLLSQGAEYDVVINLDGFNDVAVSFADNIGNDVYPYYPRLWNLYTSRLPLQDNALMQIARIAELKRTSEKRRQLFASPVLRHSQFCGLLFEVLDARCRAQIAAADLELQKVRTQSSEKHSVENFGPHREFANADEFFAAMVAYWARCSLQMNVVCRANGIAYLHLLQPNQYVPGSKPLTADAKAGAINPQTNYVFKVGVERGYPGLEAAGRKLQQEGIRFEDLTMIFKDIDEPLYEDDCCHVNKRGNDIVAKKVAAIIADSIAAQ